MQCAKQLQVDCGFKGKRQNSKYQDSDGLLYPDTKSTTLKKTNDKTNPLVLEARTMFVYGGEKETSGVLEVLFLGQGAGGKNVFIFLIIH